MTWHGQYNSCTGKVCLINACLSSLPMYLMGFYRLPKWTHAGFDKHRNAFYWNLANNKRKYCLVKWRLMCKLKGMGGLGIINISVMNTCLIIKWWRRIFNTHDSTLWHDILKAKYVPSCNPMFTLRQVVPSSGTIWWGWGILFILRLSLWLVMANISGSGPTGGVGILHFIFLFLLFFLMFLLRRFPSRISPEEMNQWQELVALFPLLLENVDQVSSPH